MSLNPAIVAQILKRGVTEIIGEKRIRENLTRHKRMRIKHGIDPTTPDLHLGHAVIYEKLRLFQKLGHTVVFIIGDFTGRFGDPTDKLHVRALRTKREVQTIARHYLRQLARILDPKRTEIHHNSEWFDRMKPEEFLRLFSYFTVGRMMERDMFRERVSRSLDIRLHEILYPALQAYDSVMIRSDLTIIGTDQLFNEIQGRKLQEGFDQPPQGILALKMLVGLDGSQKMSQSLGNFVGISEPADVMYGKLMSLPDSLIYPYFELVTRVPSGKLRVLKQDIARRPREAKARLAREVVTIYHGEVAAKKAEAEFGRIFQHHQPPSRIPVVALKPKVYSFLDLLVVLDFCRSKSEARRLIEQRALRINGETVTDWRGFLNIEGEVRIQVGKKRFVRIRTSKKKATTAR